MPVTTSAKKALRRDQRRESINRLIRSRLHSIMLQASEDPSLENISAAHSVIDRAAKKNVIHKNKASRLKSQVQNFDRKNKKTK